MPCAIALNNLFVVFVKIVIFLSFFDHLRLLVVFVIFVIACNPVDISMHDYGSSVPGNRTKGLIVPLVGRDNF